MVVLDAANGAVIATRQPNALVLEGVTRRFGNLKALDAAALTVRKGSVHALLGENGAGKTTLMRVAFGLVQPDAGSISVNGEVRKFASPSDALSAGIGMVHQHFTLIPAMTVAENVALGARGLFDRREWAERVNEIGNRTGLALNPDALVAELAVGAQQRCEIVKALAREVRILILDEPTAVLAPTEAQELLRWVRNFADEGNAVVLITHKLRDALAVADDVTVLRRGATVLSKPIHAVTENELAAAMLGQTSPSRANTAALTEMRARKTSAAIVLEARDVSVRDTRGVARVQNVSLVVKQGEILGVAGVEGAGQYELLRLLAGRLAPTSGEVVMPRAIGFVPEDRHSDALMLDATLIENIALHHAGERRGRMPWAALRDATQTIIEQHDVRATGTADVARTLSGGNQQKLIIGRELLESPVALVVENPTRGLDFRASEAVHQFLRTARDTGTAIVFYSSDLDEVLEQADRVVVMHAGRATEIDGNRDDIGRAMLGSLASVSGV